MSSRYTFENGLQKVKPYYHLQKVHAKPRWFGKTLIDIFTLEFGETEENVVSDILNHRLYIYSNYGRQGGPKLVQGLEKLRMHTLESCDYVHNNRHMHEPSVPANGDPNIQVVFQNSDVVVVNKPLGIPTHPTASYMYNSVTEMVKHELGIPDIWTCHRLDKVTSGVLILAKTQEASRYYLKIIQDKKTDISKEYVARVQGKFPEGKLMVNCPIFSVNSSGGYLKPLNSHELPANSTTLFERIKYNAELNESIIKCIPLTGKMHQIRIHLRNIGFPITNDYVYNPINSQLNNHEINELNNSIELTLYRRIFQVYPQFGKLLPAESNIINNHYTIDVPTITRWRQDEKLIEQTSHLREARQQLLNSMKKAHNVKCTECNRALFTTEKDMEGLEIWLHAFRYSYPKSIRFFDFETDLPKWCDI